MRTIVFLIAAAIAPICTAQNSNFLPNIGQLPTGGYQLVFVKYGWLHPNLTPQNYVNVPNVGLRQIVMPHNTLPGHYWVRPIPTPIQSAPYRVVIDPTAPTATPA